MTDTGETLANVQPDMLLSKLTDAECRATLQQILKAIDKAAETGRKAAVRAIGEALMDAYVWAEGRP